MPRRDSERTDSGCVCRCFLSARYPGRNVRRQLGLCWPFPYPQTMQRQHTIQMFDRHRSQKENLQGRRVARCRRVSAWCSTQHGYRTARLRNSGTLDFVSIRTDSACASSASGGGFMFLFNTNPPLRYTCGQLCQRRWNSVPASSVV